jgi:hypothetical protein
MARPFFMLERVDNRSSRRSGSPIMQSPTHNVTPLVPEMWNISAKAMDEVMAF